MPCIDCASDNEVEFSAEIMIHFSGLRNIDSPGCWCTPRFWFAWIVALLGLTSLKTSCRTLQTTWNRSERRLQLGLRAIRVACVGEVKLLHSPAEEAATGEHDFQPRQ